MSARPALAPDGKVAADLKRAFSGQSTFVDPLEKHMVNFIESRLRGDSVEEGSKSEGGDTKPGKGLYALPESLRIESKRKSDAFQPSGISEVTIPIESRLETIRQTEAAKRDMLSGGSSTALKEQPVSLPTNYAVDFQARRWESGRSELGSTETAARPRIEGSKPSDDAAFEQYRKRSRW